MANPFFYFDLGNVLVTFDHQYAVEQLAELSTRTPEKVRQVLFESELQNRYETGLVDSDEFVRQVNERLGTQLETADVLEAISAIFTLNEPILAVLAQLRNKQIPLGILSNTCQAHWQWITDRAWPVPGDWFDFAVLSYEVQSMKPDSKIYSVCEQRAGCAAADIYFTDDRHENIAAAAQRGWQTHLFHSAEQLTAQIDKWFPE